MKEPKIETVKEQIEYLARKGLNPYMFSRILAKKVLKDDELKAIFTSREDPSFKKFARLVDESVYECFQEDNWPSESDSIKWLMKKFGDGKNDFNKGTNKGKITEENGKFKAPWNIYKLNEEETLEEHRNKWQFIHYLLKYKVMAPALWIARKLFGKKLSMKVPITIYNENLLIFNQAYEDAIRDWYLLYQRSLPNPYTAGKTDEWWQRKIKNSNNSRNLRFMKDLVLGVALTDTAYREFLNLFIHNILRHGAIHYKEVQNQSFDGKIRHVFYSSGFAEDVHYLNYYRLVRDKEKSRLIETGTVEIKETKNESGKED